MGDQLNHNHSWFQEKSTNILYVMMEMRQETDYVRHHIQKVLGFFSAMRLFAQNLENQTHKIIYLRLDDERNRQSLTKNLEWIIEQNKITAFEYQLPDEYRLDEQLKAFSSKLNIPTKIYDTEHFLSQRNELADFFKGKKTFLMESFYRMMRKNMVF
jgi:deoxyribodipyrimidine photolyase-related protein